MLPLWYLDRRLGIFRRKVEFCPFHAAFGSKIFCAGLHLGRKKDMTKSMRTLGRNVLGSCLTLCMPDTGQEQVETGALENTTNGQAAPKTRPQAKPKAKMAAMKKPAKTCKKTKAQGDIKVREADCFVS